jgi:hypothetical protein
MTSAERFARKHLRVVNAKLIQKVEQLEAANREEDSLNRELLASGRQTGESLMLLETLQSSETPAAADSVTAGSGGDGERA